LVHEHVKVVDLEYREGWLVRWFVRVCSLVNVSFLASESGLNTQTYRETYRLDGLVDSIDGLINKHTVKHTVDWSIQLDWLVELSSYAVSSALCLPKSGLIYTNIM